MDVCLKRDSWLVVCTPLPDNFYHSCHGKTILFYTSVSFDCRLGSAERYQYFTVLSSDSCYMVTMAMMFMLRVEIWS